MEAVEVVQCKKYALLAGLVVFNVRPGADPLPVVESRGGERGGHSRAQRSLHSVRVPAVAMRRKRNEYNDKTRKTLCSVLNTKEVARWRPEGGGTCAS